jgi:hypothetical protein
VIDAAITIQPGPLAWGFAADPGTLTPVDSADLFDWEAYARRDKALAYRDSIVAAAVTLVALEASAAWGGAAPRPSLQFLASATLPTSGILTPISNIGAVAHVDGTSRPIDAVGVDQQLYERDALIYEALATAAEILTASPITRLAGLAISTGVISDAWSRGRGVESAATISPALPLNVDYFRRPDQALAARDNGLASAVARLEQVLRGPLDTATRVQLEVQGAGAREAETYTLASETAEKKVFQADPQLPGRMQLTYDKRLKTLRWTAEDSLAIHAPQPQPYSLGAITITGLIPGQDLALVPAAQGRQDCQFWRQKAAKLSVATREEVSIFSTLSPASYLQPSAACVGSYDSVVMLAAATAELQFPASLVAGKTYRVSCLVRPSPELRVSGGQGVGTAISVDGVVVYPATGGSAAWGLTLPAGSWTLDLQYTCAAGVPPGTFSVTMSVNGAEPQPIGLRFGVDGLEVGAVARATAPFVATGGSQVVTIAWAPPDAAAQLGVVELKFTSAVTTPVQLNLEAALWGAAAQLGVARASLIGRRRRPDVIAFNFTPPLDEPSPTLFLTWASAAQDVLLNVSGVEIQDLALATPLVNAAGFEVTRAEYLRRAYQAVLDVYPSAASVDLRQLVSAGIYSWPKAAMASWVSLLQGAEPRLDQAFRPSRPGDVGRPALLPDGLELALESVGNLSPGTVRAHYPPKLAIPVIRALQSWMIEAGAYVAHEDFWPDERVPMEISI